MQQTATTYSACRTGGSRVPVPTVATDFLACTASKPTQYTVGTSDSSGRDSSVGTLIRYGLDGLRSNPGGGRDSPHPPRGALGSTQPP